MKRKILILCAALTLAFTLTACGEQIVTKTINPPSHQNQTSFQNKN